MSTRYADCDPFARMYNLHWGKQGERHLELLDAHVLSRLPDAARILDLCGGTGQLAQVPRADEEPPVDEKKIHS